MNMYVGNLSYNVKEADLREVMEEYGTVGSVKLIIDRDTRRSKGFAFVDIEGGVLDGADRVVPLAKGDVYVFQGQQDFPAVFVQRPALRQSGGPDPFCFFLRHDPTLPKY